MKKTFTLLLLALSAAYVQAQEHALTIEIPRNDCSEIEVIDGTEKYIMAKRGDALLTLRNTFAITEGKGGEKDSNGIRERKKDYLLNGNGDTLATIINSLGMMLVEDQVIHISKELSNWTYSLASDNDTLATSTLMWNKEKWQYQMQFTQDNQLTETLKRYILLTMVDTAKRESATDCDDSMETFWMIMYASTLAQ